MGLMYVFPVSLEEEGFAEQKGETLTLKTYGLPYIFWFYAASCIAIIFFMFLAVKAPLLKLAGLGDETDVILAYSLLGFIGLLPVCILAFFFYEKRILRLNNKIILEYRVFGLKVFSESFDLTHSDELHVDSFLSSPNVARLQAREDSEGFKNKGYFVLWLNLKDGKRILIDRHSRKADLLKLKALITTGK